MAITPQDRKALASRCGIHDQYLYQILSGRKLPSPELCVLIEQESKRQIRRWDLRDDWRSIWPELIRAKGAPERQA